MDSVYNFSAVSIEGVEQSLSLYRGEVLLIVNVASKCGFTSQYKELQALYEQYHAQKFSVLGFPCNQFGHQEPDSEQQIKTFCTSSYQITFPLFSKIDVNGDQAHPLYQWLKHQKPGLMGTEMIKWNFTKFLIGRQGEVIKRYAPKDNPSSIAPDIIAACEA